MGRVRVGCGCGWGWGGVGRGGEDQGWGWHRWGGEGFECETTTCHSHYAPHPRSLRCHVPSAPTFPPLPRSLRCAAELEVELGRLREGAGRGDMRHLRLWLWTAKAAARRGGAFVKPIADQVVRSVVRSVVMPVVMPVVWARALWAADRPQRRVRLSTMVNVALTSTDRLSLLLSGVVPHPSTLPTLPSSTYPPPTSLHPPTHHCPGF